MIMSSLAIRKLPHNAPQRAMRAVARRYAAAIERRGRQATTPQWLADVWRYNCASYVRMGRNWLMLHALSNSGWYVASHFAPDTLRGGYRLLAGVRESRLPVVFTVPEDLAADLERVGWKRLPSWAATIAGKLGLPAGKILLVPTGMMVAALTAAKRVDWRNLYASDEEWSGMYCACNRRKRTRGPAYTPNQKPIATIADVWPA